MSISTVITDHSCELAESIREPYRVLVVDEHPIVREGLAALINRRSDMIVIAEASSGQDAVDQFAVQSPDLAILELNLPFMDGIETVKSICAKNPAARLVVFTTCVGEEDIYRALRAGAFGYLLKSTSLSELIECILAVAQGKRWIPPSVAAQLGKRVQDRGLTSRETQVMRALASWQEQQGNRLSPRYQRIDRQGARDPHSRKAECYRTHRGDQRRFETGTGAHGSDRGRLRLGLGGCL